MDQNLELINMLLARLERLSADSYWAHQASGIRGSLLKYVEAEAMKKSAHITKSISDRENEAADLIELGFEVLEKAAREK